MFTRLNGLFRVSISWLKCHRLCRATVPDLCGGSSFKINEESYRNLSWLIRSMRSTEIVVIGGDSNSQLGQSMKSERRIQGGRTNNGSRLIQVSGEHQFLLQKTTWVHLMSFFAFRTLDKGRHWHGSIKDCLAFWSTPANSDHGLVSACFCSCLVCRHTGTQITHHAKLVLDLWIPIMALNAATVTTEYARSEWKLEPDKITSALNSDCHAGHRIMSTSKTVNITKFICCVLMFTDVPREFHYKWDIQSPKKSTDQEPERLRWALAYLKMWKNEKHLSYRQQ